MRVRMVPREFIATYDEASKQYCVFDAPNWMLNIWSCEQFEAAFEIIHHIVPTYHPTVVAYDEPLRCCCGCGQYHLTMCETIVGHRPVLFKPGYELPVTGGTPRPATSAEIDIGVWFPTYFTTGENIPDAE